jgi:thiol-disulfide isomerase/thioredoxin
MSSSSNPDIKNILYEKIKPYLTPITFVVLVILFSIIAYYAYVTYYSKPKKHSEVKDAANSTYDKTVYIQYFHVDWCPHCKKADPEWANFTGQFNNKVVNGYTIKCIDNNCTDDEDEAISDLIQRYEIDSYPTIKMEKDGKIIEFDAKITSTALGKFVDTVVK